MKSRLQIYTSKDVKDPAYIVGERAALKELAQALIQAADSPAGFQTVTLYKGNGHDYEIFVTKNVKEAEWQDMPSTADKIDFVTEYLDLKNSLLNK
jgi:hypothetical protein